MLKIVLFVNLIWWSYCVTEDSCLSNQQKIHVILRTNQTKCTNGVCPSLGKALQQKDLNNTCVLIHKIHNETSVFEVLTLPLTFVNIHNLAIVNMQEHFIVKCNSTTGNETTNIGFTFVNSSDIRILNKNKTFTFEVHGCGMKNPSWTPAPLSRHSPPSIVTTFYFRNVHNIFLSALFMQQYFGYAIVLYDTSGNISIIDSSFQQNILINVEPYKDLKGYRSGGGIHIRYSGNNSFSQQNQIILQGCNFNSLTSEYNRFREEDDVDKNTYNSFGRGAAVSVFFQGSSRNNSIFVDKCNFSNSTAMWGGAVYLRFSDDSSNNDLVLESTQFHSNIAKYAGGAVLFVGSMKLQSYSRNKVTIFNGNFLANNVEQGYGGAVCSWRYNPDNMNNEQIEIKNTNFSQNTGNVGSAIYSIISTIVLDSILFTNNGDCPKWNSTGGIGLYMSDAHLKGEVIVKNCGNTAMYLHDSKIYIHGNLTLHNNTGTDGGAMLLLGHSKVHLLRNCVAQFTNNYATDKGGAIYVDSPGPAIHRKFKDKSHCFFGFGTHGLQNATTFNVTVRLDGNRCVGHSVNDIYASTIQPCRGASGNWIWDEYKYNSSINIDSNITVNTDPFYVKCDNCDDKTWDHLSPGIYRQIKLYLLDELNKNVNGKIEVTTSNDEEIYLKHRKRFFFIKKDKEGLNLAIVGLQNKQFDLSFSVPSTAAQPVHYSNLTLSHCPYFFTYKSNQCSCYGELGRINKGISDCFSNQIFLLIDRWTPELEHDNVPTEPTSYHCPHQYCKQCSEKDTLTGNNCKYDATRQCNESRNQTSRLCSMCLHNYTVSISDHKCHLCGSHHTSSHHTLWYFKGIAVVLLMVFFNSFIIFFIMFANRDVYASYVIPFIYFYKFSNYFLSNSFFNKYEGNLGLNLLEYFQGTYKSSFVLPVCFLEDLDNLEKLYFYLFSAISWLIAFGLNYWILGIGELLFSRSAYLRTYKIINFVFTAELLVFAFDVLKSIKIGTESYVYIYAEVKWDGSRHRPLLILAAIALGFIGLHFLIELFLVLIPLVKKLTGLSDWAYNVYDCLKITRDSCLNWYKPLAIASKFGWKYDIREVYDSAGNLITTGVDLTWFRLMHPIFLTVFMIFAAYYYDYERYTMMTIVCFIFLFIFITTRPHRNNFSNIFEVFVLGDMIMVGVITDSLDGIFYNQIESTYAVFVLLILPSVVLVAKFLHYFINYHARSIFNCMCVCGTDSRSSDIVPVPLQQYQ